jgi:hypothetical protein
MVEDEKKANNLKVNHAKTKQNPNKKRSCIRTSNLKRFQFQFLSNVNHREERYVFSYITFQSLIMKNPIFCHSLVSIKTGVIFVL